jgi:excisionase family DNA binding protein
MKNSEQIKSIPGLLRKPQAAALLGVSPRTIEREVSAGRLRKHKVRGCVCFLVEDVLRLAGIETANHAPS